jgi:hypothetical protein
MTAGTVALPVPERAGRPDKGVNRFVEIMLVGGATLVLFPLAWLLRKGVGLDDSELAIGFLTFYGAFVINDPHFAVTYLLFYKDFRKRAGAASASQRIRYLLAGVIVPAALALWAIGAMVAHSAQALGWMIQLMFLLVGWHYVKQGFGVLTVLSARRDVRFTRLERVVVLAHCFAGWAYAWASPADPGKQVEEQGLVFTTLAHPLGLERFTQIVFFLSALALIWVLVKKWRTEARLPPLAPLCGLLVTVWLWTVYSSVDPLMRYVIPALHSIQYLYFVWLLTRNKARASEGPPLFGRPARVQLGFLSVIAVGLGWILLRGAPSFLDAMFISPRAKRLDAAGGLGPTPFLAVLFAFVNIHHYFMDTVIWRRDNPETRYLLD